MAAIRALQQWCRQQCEGYRDVNITNMTTSFRDGLAFCAILHRHRPDLIDYDALQKENIYENNKLAFQVAEEELGIPALLDAEDMVTLKVPDRLSILTYVSQYYNYFHGRAPIGGMASMKPSLGDSDAERSGKNMLPQPASSEQTKPPTRSTKQEFGAEGPPPKAGHSGGSSVSSACGICGQHVHLVQRYLVEGRLFHRSCFRCHLCSSTLHAGNYWATGEPGIFICNSHQPKTTAARSSGVSPMEPPAPSTPRQASRWREAEPEARMTTWEPKRGNSNARGRLPGTGAPFSGTPTLGPRLSTAGKGSSPVANRSPAGWSSRMQNVAVPSPHSAVTPSPVSPGPASTPAWTPSASRMPATPGTSREQALSFLRKVLPGPSSDASLPLSSTTLNFHPGSAERPQARPAANRPPQGDPRKTQPPAPPNVSTPTAADRSRGAVTTEVDSAGSRPKPKASLVKGPRNSPPGSEEGPAAWRGLLKPVQKKSAWRTLEPTEPLRAREAPQNLSGSPEGHTRITVTPSQPDRIAGTAGLGFRPAAASPDPTPRRKLLVPYHSLILSGDWDQREPSSQQEEVEPQTQRNLGSPLTPRDQAETSAVRLHPDYIPPDKIQREVQAIGNQLDMLERAGVRLEKRLRAAEGDPSEDTLMVEWFHLIHEKQQLLRQESELMYKARDQDLEQRQLDLQDELRRLMDKPEALKSPKDRQREQELLDQYVSTVNDRSDIVDFLDEDRLREREEDEVLRNMMKSLDFRRSSRDQRKKPKSRLSRFWSLKGRTRTPE